MVATEAELMAKLERLHNRYKAVRQELESLREKRRLSSKK